LREGRDIVTHTKSQAGRPFRRPRRREEDNIKMDLNKVSWRGLDSAGSEYGPVIGLFEHGNEPSGLIEGGELLDYMNNYHFLRSTLSNGVNSKI
jgi:hypothetical protein